MSIAPPIDLRIECRNIIQKARGRPTGRRIASPPRCLPCASHTPCGEGDHGEACPQEASRIGGGAKTAYIERGSPWENGYCENFNSKLRDELLNGEIFYTLQEAKVIIENWRRHYNTIRPHSSLGYRPPAPEAFMPARPAPQSGPAAPHALTLAPRPSLN